MNDGDGENEAGTDKGGDAETQEECGQGQTKGE